ncbi:amidase [Lentibacillus sp. N15]|uniref:amidase n=1 Tax=Lentibacillus songyuanensis TaxID=3136161 RepID=UPI0031BA77CD
MVQTVNQQQQSIIEMDATEVAVHIREHKITSLDAVHAYIKQINSVNPRINAMVEKRFEKAIEEAKEKDQQHNSSNVTGELYGVPISVKEAYDVAGMKTTGGLLHRENAIAKADANVITRLKRAGAIILGKTNTPELCFCQETENKLYGRTNNPWDLQRTAGGSSGGEGALLAAGGAAVGIGSDIGGSIRFPSHFNGVIGFKSGMFQVNGNGHFPGNETGLQQRMLGFGPMGKSVRDIQLMYDVIAKQSSIPKDLNGVEIDILPAKTGYPLSANTAAALDNVAHYLMESFPVKRTIPPFFDQSALLWQEIMSMDGAKNVTDVALPYHSKSMLKEFIKEKVTKNAAVHTYLSWAVIGAKMFKPTKKRIAEVQDILIKGDRLLHNYLSNRVLVFPVYHTGAAKHGNVYKEIFSIKKTFLTYMPYVAYANVWGLPSLVIPVGTDEQGMPISVQLISQNTNEDILFQLGEKLESYFRGYVPCQKLQAFH